MTDTPIPSGLYCQFEDRSVSANPIPLKRVHLDVDILDFLAKVEVEQEYVNREENPIEAVYFFPVEEEAAVTSFRAEIDGRTIVTKLKEKKAAQAEYDEAISSGKSAVKLEQVKTDVFQINIGQLKPGAGAKIKLTYISELLVEDKKVRLSVPTTIAPRYIPAEDKNVKDASDKDTSAKEASLKEASAKLSAIPYSPSSPAPLAINIVARSKHRILSLTSPTHNLALDKIATDPSQPTLSMVTAGIKGSTCDMDRDLVVLLEAENIHDPVVYTEKCLETGTIAALVSLVPSFKIQDADAPCPEFVFLVDCSGSMSGSSIRQARKALDLFLHALPAECYLNIVRYGSSFKKLFSESKKYDDDTLKRAKASVDAMHADLGGTEVFAPLKWVLQKPPAAKECQNGKQVFLLTDGDVGNDEEIKRMVREECKKSKARVFTLGIGSGASRNLVKGVARAGSGTAVFSTEQEDLRPKVLKQLGDSLQPEIKDVAIEWNPKQKDGDVYSSYGQCPSVLPPVFDGQRMLSYTLFEKKAPSSVTVKAETPDGTLKVKLPVSKNPLVDGKIVHQLGARKKIQEIEESSSWNNFKQVNEAVLKLSLAHGLASSQASFIGVDEKEDQSEYKCMVKREVPNQVPNSYGAPVMYMSGALGGGCGGSSSSSGSSDDEDYVAHCRSRRLRGVRRSVSSSSCSEEEREMVSYDALELDVPMPKKCASAGAQAQSQSSRSSEISSESEDGFDRAMEKAGSAPAAQPKDEFEALIHLQKFSGQFTHGEVFESLTGKTKAELDAAKPKEVTGDIWTTALALALLKKKFSQKKSMWLLMADKAQKWMDKELKKINSNEAKKLAADLQQAVDSLMK